MTPAIKTANIKKVSHVQQKPHHVEYGVHLVPSPYFRWKGILDRAGAALMLIAALPVIAALMLLVKLSSPGPAIFRQKRVGKNGRCFWILKLRTMRADAEHGSGAVWSQKGDPRVTLLGRVLRKLHLDELPQLINVLRGEMSLIGPRPERPEFVPALAERIPGYLDRLAVLPGVTGLAQVNLPADSDLHGVRKKLALDLEYVHEANFWLDIRILICTAGRMIRFPLRRILGLRRELRLPEIVLDASILAEGAGTVGIDGAFGTPRN